MLSKICTLTILLLVLTCPQYSRAETGSNTVKDRLPKELLDEDADFLTLTIENDNFGKGTDQNYTSGVRLTYFNYSVEVPDFAYRLADFVPTFEINETTSVYYSAGQNLYTPEDITSRTPDSEDRPYAAFLYGSAGFTSLTNNHIDEMEVTLGVIGPWALGQEAQKFVHDIIEVDDPSGWDKQLDNEPGFILSWQRQWPAAYTAKTGSLNFRAMPHAGVSLGNVYIYGSAGLSLQLTPSEYKWQSNPLRVRPSIPGSGFFAVPDSHFAWSLFAGLEGRAVGRNIFLDGNTFSDSPSVDKKYFVADLNAGLSMTYGRTQISYTLDWRSEEFQGQDDASLFGAVSVGYRF